MPSESAVTDDVRIGPGIRVVGDMAVTGDAKLWVAGAIDGDVTAPSGRLTVAPGGRIRGDVRVREARIEGAVQGDIEVRDGLTLTGSGTVSGSTTAGDRTTRRAPTIGGTGDDPKREGAGESRAESLRVRPPPERT